MSVIIRQNIQKETNVIDIKCFASNEKAKTKYPHPHRRAFNGYAKSESTAGIREHELLQIVYNLPLILNK